MTINFHKLLICFRKKKPQKIVKKESVQPSFTKTPNSNPIIEDTETSRAKKPVNKKVETQTLSSFPEVKSPLPSVRNYPEDANPDWLIGIDGEGDKVRTPPAGDASSITLTGAVTGNGSLENPVNTTLTAPINAQNNRIVNVSSPVNITDAANKSYVDSQSGGGTVTLQGSVIGTGAVGTAIDTVLAPTVSIETIEPITRNFYFRWPDSTVHERIINHEIPEIATTNRAFGTNIFVKDGASAERSWLEYFNLGDPTSNYGEYFLRFWDEDTGSHTPLSIYSGGINTTFIRTKLDLDGNRVTNAADPISDQDLTTKKWVLDNAGGESGDLLISESTPVGGDIALNTEIQWNQSTEQTQSGLLIHSVSPTHFELQPGHMYELIALVPLKAASTATSTGVQWQWFQGSTPIGIKGSSLSDMGNWTQEDDFRPAISIFNVVGSPAQVHLEFTSIYSGIRFSQGNYGYCKIRTLN